MSTETGEVSMERSFDMPHNDTGGAGRQNDDKGTKRVSNMAEDSLTNVEIPASDQKWCRNDTIPLASIGKDSK